METPQCLHTLLLKIDLPNDLQLPSKLVFRPIPRCPFAYCVCYCMCVRVCLCVCVCKRVRQNERERERVSVCARACPSVYLSLTYRDRLTDRHRVYKETHTDTDTQTQTHWHRHTHRHTHTETHTHRDTQTHTHTSVRAGGVDRGLKYPSGWRDRCLVFCCRTRELLGRSFIEKGTRQKYSIHHAD